MGEIEERLTQAEKIAKIADMVTGLSGDKDDRHER